MNDKPPHNAGYETPTFMHMVIDTPCFPGSAGRDITVWKVSEVWIQTAVSPIRIIHLEDNGKLVRLFLALHFEQKGIKHVVILSRPYGCLPMATGLSIA